MTTAVGTAATRPPPVRLQYCGLCCPFFETDEEHDRPIAWHWKKRAEEVVVDDDTANKLRVVSSENEQVIKELNAKIRELDNLKAENEKYAAIIDEKTAGANREIKSLRAELDLSRQAYDSAIADQNVTIEVMWDDREKAREDLKDSQAHVQRLIDANVEAEDEIRKLKEEAEKHRVEIKTLHESLKFFDANVEAEDELCQLKEEAEKHRVFFELGDENKRLKKRRLDETTGDILGSIQGNDGSESSIEAVKIGNDSRHDVSGKGVLNSTMLALPSLVDEVRTEISVLDEAKTPQRNKSVDDKLETSEKECYRHRADITRSRREGDALPKMVDTLLPLADGNDMVQLKSLENEVADLKAKLSQAEDACIKIEVEKCEILASITHERDALASQVKEMNTLVLSYHLGNTSDTAMKELEESAATDSAAYTLPEILLFLKKKMKIQVQQTIMAVWHLQHMLDAQVKKNEKLSTELAALRGKIDLEVHTSTSIETAPTCDMTEAPSSSYDEGSLCETYTNSINSVIEVGSHEDRKLDPIKREPVAKSPLSDKQVSEGNDQQLSEVAINPPVDLEAEFKERIGDLESVLLNVFSHSMEGSMNDEAILSGKSQEPRSESGQDATNMIELNDILTRSLDEQPGSKIPLASFHESFSSDKNQVEELDCRGIENKVKKMKTKVRVDQLTKLPPQSVENECTQTCAVSVGDSSAQTALANEHWEDFESLQTAYICLQKKSKHFMKELEDSNQAFRETIASYASDIAKVKTELSEKELENEILKSDLEKVRGDLANLAVKMENVASEDGKTHADTLKAHMEELNAYREAVDVLQRRLEEEEAVKTKLNMEVEQLKADVTIVISQFEQELTLSCEASDKALQQKRKERDDAFAALSAKEKEFRELVTELEEAEEAISNFEQNGYEYTQQIFEYEKTIHSLRDELGHAESDRQHTESAFDQLKESKQVEVQKLQQKLNGVLVSNKEGMQVYEQLLAKCTSLKADKETALENNVELTAAVQELQNQLDGAIVSNKERTQLYEQLRADYASLKADKDSALEKNAELTAEVHELQKKLNGAIVLNKESTQLYEKLRANCASLNADKETALEKNAELTANITTLRAENGALVFQKEKQCQSLDLIENQLESVRKEVIAVREDRIKASQRVADQENCIRSLREEVRWAEDAKQKASIAAEASQNDLMEANKRLDDMLVYTQKLKVEHKERELSLRSNNMDSQMLSLNEVIQSLQRQVKSIESEKEENMTMYERDISLQQEEIHKLQTNHLDAIKKVDSLSDLVSTLKLTLAIEKESFQILLSQFKTSEDERKSYMKQIKELEIEVASRVKSESALSERICNMQGLETELESRIKSENSKAEQICHLEMELADTHSKIKAKEQELMENANMHNAELNELKSKIDEGNRKQTAMQELIRSMESHTASLQQEFKCTLNKSVEEASKLSLILEEEKGKLKQLHDQNEELKRNKDEAVQTLQQMLYDAVRIRTNTDASFQESLQLLEQQKRNDIKRKGEISKLEQTVEMLKSRERHLEGYVASLKKQTRGG